MLGYERSLISVDDESVKRLKGERRPINNCATRAAQLNALPWVDEVVIFSSDTPIKEIEKYQPDIIIKGGDYKREDVVGHKVAKVKIFPFVKDLSTSETIKRIEERNQ